MVFDKFNGFAIDNRSNLKKGGKSGERRKVRKKLRAKKTEERGK